MWGLWGGHGERGGVGVGVVVGLMEEWHGSGLRQGDLGFCWDFVGILSGFCWDLGFLRGMRLGWGGFGCGRRLVRCWKGGGVERWDLGMGMGLRLVF